MKIKIPLYYYPTKIMMVDDDAMFSQSIALKLHESSLNLFSSPQAALSILSNNIHQHQDHTLFQVTDAIDTHTMTLDHEALHKLALTHNNTQIISTVLVDFHMPEMTGIEFLHKIEHLPLQKILLTGEQDFTIAINAFNNGLIDKYIRKNAMDFIKELQTVVREAEWQYFLNLSETLSNTVGNDLSFLHNAELSELFQTILREQQIIAFALCHSQGDFILLDSEGNKRYFLVRTATQLQQLAKIAQEDGGSEETAQKLNSLKVIPFFGVDKNTWDFPAHTWDPYLFTANQLDATATLLWAFINTP